MAGCLNHPRAVPDENDLVEADSAGPAAEPPRFIGVRS